VLDKLTRKENEMEITVKKWAKGNLTRYYLAEGTNPLGYVHIIAKLNRTNDPVEIISHTIEDPKVLEAVSVVNYAGELEPSTPLLNKHSGTYGVVRGKRKPVWIKAEPILS
jgi:hypothetical protein